MISTRNLSLLPDVDRLKALMQSMALLDAILQPEWQYRFYSFNSKWSAGEQMGSMRNGQGDDFFAWFNAAGCWLKGFAHEAPMSPYRDDSSRQVWPGVLDTIPAEFAECLTEPAFNIAEATFCIWRRYGDASWQRGAIVFPKGHRDPDGSAYLLSPLDDRPETYTEWAMIHFSKPSLDVELVRHIYEHRQLTKKLVEQLNPAISLEDLTADIKEISYPSKVQR
jgi:hypothetical protein